MTRLQNVLRLTLTTLLVGGCVGEIEDPTTASDEAVLDHIEALGFERGEAAVLEDRVVVQGDILFDRAGLLSGEYERWTQPEDGELIEKGYRYPDLVAAKHRSNLRILFAKGDYAPTKEMRSAFLAAAKAWSEVPGSSIRISPENTGPAMVVRMVPVGLWPKYSGCKDADACAYAPRNGRPGYDILVRAKTRNKGCATWSPSHLAYVARHELGHAIGFAHPKEAGSKPVKGTKTCSLATEEACTYEPGYTTVMGAATIEAGCVYSPARIGKDDYATCAATYPGN